MTDSLQYVIYIINLYLCLLKNTKNQKGKGGEREKVEGESGHLSSLVQRPRKETLVKGQSEHHSKTSNKTAQHNKTRTRTK